MTGGAVLVTQLKAAEAIERFWGPFGRRHLCVSAAMQTELQKRWGIQATLFYDRAPSHFRPITLRQQVRGPKCSTPVCPIQRSGRTLKKACMCRAAFMRAWKESDVQGLCGVKHELLLRLGPLLDAPVHPRDCCAVMPVANGAAHSDNNHDAQSSIRPLPVSRRASAASQDDLNKLLDQVALAM